MHDTTRHDAGIELSGQGQLGRVPLAGSTRLVAASMLMSDIIAIFVAFLLTSFAAQLANPAFAGAAFDPLPLLLDRAPEFGVLTALTVAVLSFGGLYRKESWEVEELRKIVLGIGVVAVFDICQRITQGTSGDLLWSILAWPTVAGLVLISRMLLRAMPSVQQAMTSNMIIVGSATNFEDLRNQLSNSRGNKFRLIGELSIERLLNSSEAMLDAHLRSIVMSAGAGNAQILLAPGPDQQQLTEQAIERLNAAGRPFTMLIPYTGLARRELSLHKPIGADFVVSQISNPETRSSEQMLKAAIDFSVTLLALVILAPLMLVVSALLAMENGPVFFSQLRVGQDGRRFRCLKFRTMLPNAEERLAELLSSNPAARAEWEAHQKLAKDPRITRVGQFLRATSLDELPQLFNVLRGEMSLVGPRPIIAPEVPGYACDHAYFESPEIAFYKRCRPGITGLWQVSGRARTTHQERVRLDCWYARNWSLWLDLIILVKTFRAVVARTGS